MRGIGRRQGNPGQRGEDLVGWASGHLDRGRGHLHVLTIEALHGKIGEAKFVEVTSDHGIVGAERVVSRLTEELVQLGHDVTLFASGDSEISARLFPDCERAQRVIAISAVAAAEQALDQRFKPLVAQPAV